MDRLLAEGWLRGVEWSGTRWLEVGDKGEWATGRRYLWMLLARRMSFGLQVGR